MAVNLITPAVVVEGKNRLTTFPGLTTFVFVKLSEIRFSRQRKAFLTKEEVALVRKLEVRP